MFSAVCDIVRFMKKQKISIHWFRQDLRLQYNPAWYSACQNENVLPIFILDEQAAGDHHLGAASRVWLHQSLTQLNEALDHKLAFFRGPAQQIFSQLLEQYDVTSVYWNRCYEPWRITRDKLLKAYLQEQGVKVESHKSELLWEPWEILKDDNSPYKVFSPYYKKCFKHKDRILLPVGSVKVPTLVRCPVSLSLEDLQLLPKIPWHHQLLSHWQPGEQGAQNQWQRFLRESIASYKVGRDIPAKNSLSRLSPHIHFGEISVAQIWHETMKRDFLANEEHFLRELGWREFSYHLLFHFPELPRQNLNTKFDLFPWQQSSPLYKAWCDGQTGFPIIDAGMRELYQTGYMHNRVRMLVGSFLVKNLLLDWRLGERWFWDTLFDADLANNSASWQWVAGSGADAAPYFRIFNPVLQGEKFDPHGDYVKKYVPELKKLERKYLHKPWEAPMDVLLAAGLRLGKDYPHPVVDIKKSRDSALEAYEQIKAKA